MKLTVNNKVGVLVTPAFSIMLYFIFVTLDIYTTFLVTPDLKFESNLIIQFFSLSWSQIIILALIMVILISTFFFFSMNFIHSYYVTKSDELQSSFHKDVLPKKIFLVSFIIMVIFYAHFISSIFVSINNYLNFIYLYRKESSLFQIATSLVKMETILHEHYFLYTQLTAAFAGFVFTLYQVFRVKKRYYD